MANATIAPIAIHEPRERKLTSSAVWLMGESAFGIFITTIERAPMDLPLRNVAAAVPRTAVVAVTLNCNARCVMCDIWKNKETGELQPSEYSKLPSSLRDINISGGEPFLRKDLPELIGVVKETCPKARLVISSNGFLPERIEHQLTEIIRIDPKIGLRISIDGFGEMHEQIRGIPRGYEKNLRVLEMARQLGIRDLGIGMTIMGQNLDHVRPLYKMTVEQGLEFSVTVATDSSIFFGEDKEEFRPDDATRTKREFDWLVQQEYRSRQPKRWFRAWYEKRLLKYLLEGKRPMTCDAGSGFFYLDSHGQVYACHLLPLRMGNIRQNSWEDVWHSDEASKSRTEAKTCDKCWMVCTSKSQIRKKLPMIGTQVLMEKLGAHVTSLPDASQTVETTSLNAKATSKSDEDSLELVSLSETHES